MSQDRTRDQTWDRISRLLIIRIYIIAMDEYFSKIAGVIFFAWITFSSRRYEGIYCAMVSRWWASGVDKSDHAWMRIFFIEHLSANISYVAPISDRSSRTYLKSLRYHRHLLTVHRSSTRFFELIVLSYVTFILIFNLDIASWARGRTDADRSREVEHLPLWRRKVCTRVQRRAQKKVRAVFTESRKNYAWRAQSL